MMRGGGIVFEGIEISPHTYSLVTIKLNDQTVAITGAANGIGLAIANAFLDSGAQVLAIDLDRDGLSQLESTAPGRVDTLLADIADFDSLKVGIREREVDHLVCAAAKGSGKTGFPFWKLEPSDWRQVLDVTLMGTVNTVQAFAPALLDGDTFRKSVLLLTSVAGQIGSQTDPPYSASKAAVINFAQVAAKDFSVYGIRVNALAPGMVRTELNRSVFESSKEAKEMSYDEWAKEKIDRVVPLGRWQEPAEFGAMAVFLTSEFGRNITGQTINIDGGQVMHS
jgi:2-hydroxycyclohexanecarboxyl-CoA dehydrogenase